MTQNDGQWGEQYPELSQPGAAANPYYGDGAWGGDELSGQPAPAGYPDQQWADPAYPAGYGEQPYADPQYPGGYGEQPYADPQYPGGYVDPAYAADPYAAGGYVDPAYADPAYADPAYADPDPYAAGGYVDPAYASGVAEEGWSEPAYDPAQTYDPPGEVLDDSDVVQLTPQSIESAQYLLQVIADDECTEVIINGPNEVLQKVKGKRYHLPNITFEDAEQYHAALNQYVLPYTDTIDRIDGKNPLVEGQLEIPSADPNVPPMLARCHVLAPPLVQFAKVTIAKKARYEYDLDAIASTGALSRGMTEFLKAAARGRLNIVISGVTGAGKTTLLQSLTHYYDSNDRIVVIEDTPELRLPIADVVHLYSSPFKPGMKPEDHVTIEWLVRQAQRMRMDRLLVGEVRGAEMAEWLLAANSGAEGSATTIHADNPRRALDKMLALATKSPTASSEMTLRREIAATVDIIVQASLIDGQHVITHVEEVSNTVRQDTGIIATTNLFEYDRYQRQFVAKNPPSDDMVSMLKNRGVPIQMAWFGRGQR